MPSRKDTLGAATAQWIKVVFKDEMFTAAQFIDKYQEMFNRGIAVEGILPPADYFVLHNRLRFLYVKGYLIRINTSDTRKGWKTAGEPTIISRPPEPETEAYNFSDEENWRVDKLKKEGLTHTEAVAQVFKERQK